MDWIVWIVDSHRTGSGLDRGRRTGSWTAIDSDGLDRGWLDRGQPSWIVRGSWTAIDSDDDPPIRWIVDWIVDGLDRGQPSIRAAINPGGHPRPSRQTASRIWILDSHQWTGLLSMDRDGFWTAIDPDDDWILIGPCASTTVGARPLDSRRSWSSTVADEAGVLDRHPRHRGPIGCGGLAAYAQKPPNPVGLVGAGMRCGALPQAPGPASATVSPLDGTPAPR